MPVHFDEVDTVQYNTIHRSRFKVFVFVGQGKQVWGGKGSANKVVSNESG